MPATRRATGLPGRRRVQNRGGYPLSPWSTGVGFFFGLEFRANWTCYGRYGFWLNGPPAPVHIKQYFSRTENQKRDGKRRQIVKQTKQQQPGQDGLLVELPQRDEHGGIKYAEPARSVARKAQQKCST